MTKLEHTEYGFVKDKGQWKCYCTVISVAQANGKKWRPSSYGKTKREAREKLEKKLADKAKELRSEEKTQKPANKKSSRN